MSLTDKRCVPCEGGVPPLATRAISELLEEVPGWTVSGQKIKRTLEHSDFVAAMRFVNRMADIAEEEGHHPDFAVHYSTVVVTIWTHAIGGLSENDFILAAKLNQAASEPAPAG